MISIFWGAGKIGRKLLKYCEKLNIKPDYLVDSNPEMIGKKCVCMEINSIDTIKQLIGKKRIYITFFDKNGSINQQLEDMRISDFELVDYTDFKIALLDILNKYNNNFSQQEVKTVQSVVFDYENGDILGGVEEWSNMTINMLENKYECLKILNSNFQVVMDSILGKKTCAIVSNFALNNFFDACIAKVKNPNIVKLIVVLHNDRDYYYDIYNMYKDYIDICLTISNRMRKKLIKKGFPESKIKELNWAIDSKKIVIRDNRKAKSKLKVCYAGRLNFCQKRIDILCKVIEKTCKNLEEVEFNIAGEGEAYKYLEEFIKEKGIEGNVNIFGKVVHNKMSEFWYSQDIMVSCSLYEGHSISQYEAMAYGVVPIVTDVSGAEDDIEDGKNGFIINQSYDETIINDIYEKIMYLYYERKLLSQMSVNAQQTIMKKNDIQKLICFWDEILA